MPLLKKKNCSDIKKSQSNATPTDDTTQDAPWFHGMHSRCDWMQSEPCKACVKKFCDVRSALTSRLRTDQIESSSMPEFLLWIPVFEFSVRDERIV